MPRPHIEFVQQQDLPFEPVVLPGGAADGAPIGRKILSRDDASDAWSGLVQVPAGWRWPEVGHLGVDLEVYVLSGDLTHAGQCFREHSYTFLPAGSALGEAASKAGAVALVFMSSRAEWIAGSAPASPDQEQRRVPYLDLFDGPWTGNFHPQFPAGAGRKWLRRDPVTRDESWILGTLPLRHGARPEKHPVVEEMYLLSGELIGPQGVMRPGAYFWRPPEEWHGPYGSKTGCLMLFRTVGGPLSTVYDEQECAFDWSPDGCRPILPPDLRQLVGLTAVSPLSRA